MADRYFPGDEPRLTQRLDGFLASLHDSLKEAPWASDVIALLLGGGYGRGEGGIYLGPDTAEPGLYNDLEFYVVTSGLRAPPELHAWCKKWETGGHGVLGIEVEFKILPASALRSGQPSMFYYDLLLGNHLVFGDAGFCAALPEKLRDSSAIPATEVTRLLFNRGSGLLFCREILDSNPQEFNSGFIERNHAKAWLALADAVLALNGRYDWSCLSRHLRTEEGLPLVPPDWTVLKKWHAQGVEFKLHPRHQFPGLAVLQQRQKEIVQVWLRTFLWTESIRLKRSFSNAEAYASDSRRIFPESSVLKNILLRVRDQIKTGSRLPTPFDYPRGSLQRVLVLLLGPTENNATIWQRASSLLGLSKTADAQTVMHAYRTWWHRYN